jgi:hypothetical protein
MANFFANIESERAAELEQLSQLIYELQDNRNALLRFHGAADEAALLRQIESGTVDEHPGYEHYLAARILDDTREAARALVGETLKEINRK